MTHIASIGAGMYSDMSVATPVSDLSASAIAALDTASEFAALFASEIPSQGGTKGASTFVRLKNVREYPPMGTPPNVVNVPVFGSSTAQQIQGQADAPSMELTLNFVPSEWAKETDNILGNIVGDGNQYVFRFTMLNAEPTGTDSSTKFASLPAGLGTVGNTAFYWIGKIEALQATPQLTDANTATLTLTVQSRFFGAFTVDPI